MPPEMEQEVSQEQESQDKDFELEIEDDTPEEDRNRQPLPKEIVQELEQDELEEYSDKVKTRLKQMKKVWHDERREKEQALREQQQALALAQKIMEENKRLKATLTEGEKSYLDTAKNAANLELEMAKKAYKEAYDAGDSDRLVEAQEKLNNATYRMQQVQNYKPTLQVPENTVQNTQEQIPAPRVDPKTLAWQERNTWYGRDPEMTALALGLHQKLESQYGAGFTGSDDYWQRIDETMRRRFPDYFGEEEVKTTDGGGKPVQRTETKPATVVAPASRSTSAKKIVLKASEISIAKKFGLTPEQYAKEKLRLENQNG